MSFKYFPNKIWRSFSMLKTAQVSLALEKLRQSHINSMGMPNNNIALSYGFIIRVTKG